MLPSSQCVGQRVGTVERGGDDERGARRACRGEPERDDEQRHEHDAATRGEQSRRPGRRRGDARDDDRRAVDTRVRNAVDAIAHRQHHPDSHHDEQQARREQQHTRRPRRGTAVAPTITVGTAASTASRATRRSSTPARRYCRAPTSADGQHGGERRRDRDRSRGLRGAPGSACRTPIRPHRRGRRRSRCRRRRGPRGAGTHRHRPPREIEKSKT